MNSKYPQRTQKQVMPDFGKVPPQAIEIEQAVLGTIINHFHLIAKYPYLKPEVFYKESHQKIYKALVKLYDDDAKPDLLILQDYLRSIYELESVGGPLYLTQLSGMGLTDIDTHSKIIYDKYMSREIIRISYESQQKAFGMTADPLDIIDFLQNSLMTLTEFDGDVQNNFVKSLQRTIEHIDTASKGEAVTVLKTGFKRFDQLFTLRVRYVCLIGGSEGSGKCFGINTPVLMYDHSIKMIQDIIPGDILMGPDGTERTVQTLGRGFSKLYKVNQRHGMSYIVNEGHILSLKNIGHFQKNKQTNEIKKIRFNKVINIPIEDYLKRSKTFKYLHKGYKGNSSEFNIKVKIPPYLLGLWLGDGSKAYPQITNPDIEVIKYLQDNFRCKEVTGKRLGDCRSFYLSGLKDKFKYYDLLYNKHIPNDYLINTREVKLELLAGILDADGSINKPYKETKTILNSYEITQKNEILADNIVMLCQSLGLYVKKTSKTARIKSINYSCKVYRLYISGININEIPFKIKRKQCQHIETNYDPTLSTLSIEDHGSGNYYGITVDKDELFMLSDYTVVHNTKLVTSLARGILDNEPDIAIQWFTFEDDREAIIRSFLAMDLKMTTRELQSIDYQITDTDKENICNTSKKYEKYIIEFYDRATSIGNILSRAKRFSDKYRNKKRLVIIDNLGLIECDKSGIDRDDFIAAKVKSVADNNNVSVMLLHHFTKEIDRKANIAEGYRPRKEYLKGSTRILDYVQQALFVNLLRKHPDLIAEEKHLTLDFIGNNPVEFTEANFDKHLWQINSTPDKDTKNITDLRMETFIKVKSLLNNETKFSNGKVITFSNLVQKYAEYNAFTDTRNKGREERFKTAKSSIYMFIMRKEYNANYVSDTNNPRSLYLYGKHPNLKHHIDNLFILESGKNRDGDNLDENALFRFICDLGYNIFKEVNNDGTFDPL